MGGAARACQAHLRTGPPPGDRGAVARGGRATEAGQEHNGQGAVHRLQPSLPVQAHVLGDGRGARSMPVHGGREEAAVLPGPLLALRADGAAEHRHVPRARRPLPRAHVAVDVCRWPRQSGARVSERSLWRADNGQDEPAHEAAGVRGVRRRCWWWC